MLDADGYVIGMHYVTGPSDGPGTPPRRSKHSKEIMQACLALRAKLPPLLSDDGSVITDTVPPTRIHYSTFVGMELVAAGDDDEVEDDDDE